MWGGGLYLLYRPDFPISKAGVRAPGMGLGRRGRERGVTAPGSSDGCWAAQGAHCALAGAVLPPRRPGPGRAGAVLPPVGSGAGSGAAAEPLSALPAAAAMAEGSEKVPIARAGPDDVEQCLPPVSAAGRHRAGRDGTGPGGAGWDGVRNGLDRDETCRDGSGRNGAERVGSSRVGTEQGRNGRGWDGMGQVGSWWVGTGRDASDWDGSGWVGTDQGRDGSGTGPDAAARTSGPGTSRFGARPGIPAGPGGLCPAPSTALSAGVRGGGPRARAAAEGGGCGADRRSPPAAGRGHRRLLLLESHRAAGERGRPPSLETSSQQNGVGL